MYNSIRPIKSIPVAALLLLLFFSVPGTAQVRMATTHLPLYSSSGAFNTLLQTAGVNAYDYLKGERISFSSEQLRPLHVIRQPNHDLFKGRTITLSYEGSSGLLGFSAGYIYTTPETNYQPTLLLDLDSDPTAPFDHSRSWYLAIDLSHSFQLGNDITLGLGSKTALMDDPFADEDQRILSFLLNMPVLIKDFLTITPELQWSRTLPGGVLNNFNLQDITGHKPADNFYGGVSISFSY